MRHWFEPKLHVPLLASPARKGDAPNHANPVHAEGKTCTRQNHPLQLLVTEVGRIKGSKGNSSIHYNTFNQM